MLKLNITFDCSQYFKNFNLNYKHHFQAINEIKSFRQIHENSKLMTKRIYWSIFFFKIYRKR